MFFHLIGELAGLSNLPTAMTVRSLAVHWAWCVDDADTGGESKVKGLDHEKFEQPHEKAVKSIMRNRLRIGPQVRFITNPSAQNFTWLEIPIESVIVTIPWREQATMADFPKFGSINRSEL